jgi:ubiquinone/menaquinone biosynthesis C-methylase UbiE
VCADANSALPFADGTFSAAVCSDAFHYFTHKSTCIRELIRLTQPEGFIALATLRNALVKKKTGMLIRAFHPKATRDS